MPVFLCIHISLIKRHFVIMHHYIILQERENTWPILNWPTLQHVTFVQKYKDMQLFCGHTILTGVSERQMSINARISFWQIVQVTTNCCSWAICRHGVFKRLNSFKKFQLSFHPYKHTNYNKSNQPHTVSVETDHGKIMSPVKQVFYKMSKSIQWHTYNSYKTNVLPV